MVPTEEYDTGKAFHKESPNFRLWTSKVFHTRGNLDANLDFHRILKDNDLTLDNAIKAL